MKLQELIVESALIPALEGVNRDAVIREMVAALVRAGIIEPAHEDKIIASILDREKKGSTGFGKGVAVPHVKHSSIRKMCATIGVSAKGVEFNALDRQPVYSVFMLLSPADQPEQHLRAMEIIFGNLSQDTFRRFLKQASTVDDILTLLREADSDQLVK